jgi:hypothetical protein
VSPRTGLDAAEGDRFLPLPGMEYQSSSPSADVKMMKSRRLNAGLHVGLARQAMHVVLVGEPIANSN